MGKKRAETRLTKKSLRPFETMENSKGLSPFTAGDFGMAFLALVLLLPALILTWQMLDANREVKTLNLAYAAFLLGTVFEFRRVVGNWRDVALVLAVSYGGSLLNFLPYKKERTYDLQDHIDHWPIAFAAFFTFCVTVGYSKKLTVRLGEGVTMLHTLTLLYFCAELSRTAPSTVQWILAGALALPSLFSLFHALTYAEITQKDRLYLSLWNSFVMAVFAVLYVVKVLQMAGVEELLSENQLLAAIEVFVEHFLLGASGAYILQNLVMLGAYLPDKNRMFNKAYFADVREINQSHIERYSADQIDKREALFVLGLAGALFVGNYHFQIAPRGLVVWFSLTVIPLLVGLLSRRG
jgi:hypothetical protein